MRLRVGHHLVLVDRLVLPVRGESFRGSIEDVALRREGGREGGREREACWSLDDSSAKRKEEKEEEEARDRERGKIRPTSS